MASLVLPEIIEIEDFRLSRSETVTRFGSPVTKEDIDKAIKNRVPEKTRRATQWAVSVFKARCNAREIRGSLEELSIQVRQDLLPKFAKFRRVTSYWLSVKRTSLRDESKVEIEYVHNTSLSQFWLSIHFQVFLLYFTWEELSIQVLQDLLPKFVLETRRQDSTPYPPNMLVQLVAGIQRHLRESGRPRMSILNEKDPTFARARAALDARMKQLTKEGVGCTRRQAQPLSVEQEETLWEKGIFCLNTGEGIMYAVFCYNCKLFGLRGGDEHRNLV